MKKKHQQTEGRSARLRASSASSLLLTPHYTTDDRTFLDAQTARLFGLFPPDKPFTPQHRLGMWFLLHPVYAECVGTQVLAGTPLKRAVHLARAYIEKLRPPSSLAFSKVTTRAARRPPQTISLFQGVYRVILPVVQAAVRELQEGVWSTNKEQAACLVKDLPRRLREQHPDLGDPWVHVVSEDVFRSRGKLVKPYCAARLLAARIVGIGDQSQVQLERYLRPVRKIWWRIPEWETAEAAAIAQQMAHLPS